LLSGANDIAGQMGVQQRLGIGHNPSRYQAGSGWKALLWKNLVCTERRAPGVSSPPGCRSSWWGWGRHWPGLGQPRLGPAGVGQPGLPAVRRFLQNDLSLWTLFRPLPVPARTLLIADLALPAMLATLLAWLLFWVVPYPASPG